MTVCPAAASHTPSDVFRVRRLPVVSNFLCRTPEASMRVPRRDVLLTQCDHCGLVFNRSYDPT